jgi:adenosine deaminase
MIEIAKPHRIGHGIQAAYSKEAMKALREKDICLEICPTSNLQTHAVSGIEDLKRVIGTFQDEKIPFTINTDNPYLSRTNLRYEIDLILQNKILDKSELALCFQRAHKYSFI